MNISSMIKEFADFAAGLAGGATGDAERAPLWTAVVISILALGAAVLALLAFFWK